MGREVESLELGASPATLSVFEGVAQDVLAAARVARAERCPREDLEAGAFEIVAIVFAERPPRD
jgi:hypothetical protein